MACKRPSACLATCWVQLEFELKEQRQHELSWARVLVWEVINISRNICTFHVFEYIWDQLRNSCPIIFLIFIFTFSLNWTCTHQQHIMWDCARFVSIKSNWTTHRHQKSFKYFGLTPIRLCYSIHKSIDNDLTRSLWLLRARGSRFIRFDLCLSNNECMENWMILTVKCTADDHNSHVN